MTGFEPRTSGVGSDCSANWATTTAPAHCTNLKYLPSKEKVLRLAAKFRLASEFLRQLIGARDFGFGVERSCIGKLTWRRRATQFGLWKDSRQFGGGLMDNFEVNWVNMETEVISIRFLSENSKTCYSPCSAPILTSLGKPTMRRPSWWAWFGTIVK